MKFTLVAVVACAAILVTSLLVSASRTIVEKTDLPNGQTRHRIRMLSDPSAKKLDAKQAREVTIVVSNYCNKTETSIAKMTPGSAKIFDGAWKVSPPESIPSFFRGEYTGFSGRVNPGDKEHVFFNYTVNYRYAPTGPYELDISGAVAEGEWMLDTVTATVMGAKIFSSEYGHMATYNVVFGEPIFTIAPVC